MRRFLWGSSVIQALGNWIPSRLPSPSMGTHRGFVGSFHGARHNIWVLSNPSLCRTNDPVIAAINSTTRPIDAPLRFLGLVSYPIYLIHWLTLYVFTYLGSKLGLTGVLYNVIAIAHLIAIPIIGWLVMTYYEGPARRWLSKLRKRRQNVVAVTAD